MEKKEYAQRLRMECHSIARECLCVVYGGEDEANRAIANEASRLGCSTAMAVMPLFCKKSAETFKVKHVIAPETRKSVDVEAIAQAGEIDGGAMDPRAPRLRGLRNIVPPARVGNGGLWEPAQIMPVPLIEDEG